MIFTRRPPYSADEISRQVTNLETLHKLQDMCIQKVVVLRNSGKTDDAAHWSRVAGRYDRNIESGQLYLRHMTDKVAGKG